jgi:hypothetical protein
MGLEVGFWKFQRGWQISQDFVGYRWEEGIAIWWACEQKREPVNRNKKAYFDYIPSMSIGILPNKFWWHVKIYPSKNIFHHVNKNSHVLIAMWIYHMDIQ